MIRPQSSFPLFLLPSSPLPAFISHELVLTSQRVQTRAENFIDMGGTSSLNVGGPISPSVTLRPATPGPETARPPSSPPVYKPYHPNPLLAAKTSYAILSDPITEAMPATNLARGKAEKNVRADIFLPLGPAFFSPSVPSSTIELWTKNGGTLHPPLAGLDRAHRNNYLNIPIPTIDALNALLTITEYPFFLPDDPLLHFVRFGAATTDPRWISDCISVGEVLEKEEYAIRLPKGPKDQVGEA